MTQRERVAQPPETLEGWYALHQIYRIDRERAGDLGGAASGVFAPQPGNDAGWSEAVTCSHAH